MARWFRGRRKPKGSEENPGENPPQQVPRSGEGALQPIYPDLERKPEAPAPAEPIAAQADRAEPDAGAATSPERPRRRRRGGRASGARKVGSDKIEGTEPAAEAAGEEAAAGADETGLPGEQPSQDETPGAARSRQPAEGEGAPQAEPARQTGQQPQRRDRGRGGRRRGRRGGRQDRVGPATPLAPTYPEERYQQPVSEISPDLPAAKERPQGHERQAKQVQHKKPRGVVVLTIGLPGSGKSSWFKRRGVAPLSSDMLRTLLFDDITEQRYQDLVFSTLRSLLRARLIAGMPWNYIDATNLSPKERHGWIKMAREYGYDVHAVFFNVPLEVCQERNQKRARVVPEEVMQRMANKLRPPNFDEGFSKIIVVRVRRADQEPQSQAQEPPGGEETEGSD